jgi:hypothetical protein
MASTIIGKYVTPWRFRREQQEQRLAALRQRDGDNCRRCRRPIRFDLPPGHDKGPSVETFDTGTAAAAEALERLCLCHGRCNAAGADHTDEVTERIRRKSEAALLSKKRRSAKAKSA